MGRGIFEEGGPHDIRRVGQDQYELSVKIPNDPDGRRARECPEEDCSPGYFKVKPGTGVPEGQEVAYCPYCRHAADPQDFTTTEQRRYAKDTLMREARKGVDRMFRDAFGLGASGRRKLVDGLISVEMTYQPGTLPSVTRPLEDELRRDVTCPHCKLDQSVYGLATWCADCGRDIFLTHVQAEIEVIRVMLADVGRRREILGNRVAARDLENCLEDAVSIFEAVLRYMYRRRQVSSGVAAEEVEEHLRKRGNAFQNLSRSEEILREEFHVELFGAVAAGAREQIQELFDKRHPITHNLGVVDRKHIERAKSMAEEGKEVLVTQDEIEFLLGSCEAIFASLHSALFPETKD